MDLLPEQRALLDGLQHRAGLPVLLWLRPVYQWPAGNVPELPAPALLGALVPPDFPGLQVQLWRRPPPHQPRAELRLQDKVHGALAVPDRDAHAVPALAQPADAVEQVLLPRVALQRPLVPQAQPLDDLRVRGHRLLPLLPGGHRDPPVLPRAAMEHPAVPADGAAGRHGEGHLRLLPAGQPGHDLHVALLAALHVQPAPLQDIRPAHHQQGRLGDVGPQEDRGELHRRRARDGVGHGAAGRRGLHHLLRDAGALQRLREGAADRGADPVRVLLGHTASALPGHCGQALQQAGGAVPPAVRRGVGGALLCVFLRALRCDFCELLATVTEPKQLYSTPG